LPIDELWFILKDERVEGIFCCKLRGRGKFVENEGMRRRLLGDEGTACSDRFVSFSGKHSEKGALHK